MSIILARGMPLLIGGRTPGETAARSGNAPYRFGTTGPFA